MTAPLQTYIADADGWVAGRRVKAGDPVELTAAAAKYEPVTPVPPDAPARAVRKGRD